MLFWSCEGNFGPGGKWWQPGTASLMTIIRPTYTYVLFALEKEITSDFYGL